MVGKDQKVKDFAAEGGSPPHGGQEQMQPSEVNGRALWQPLCHPVVTQHPVLAVQ